MPSKLNHLTPAQQKTFFKQLNYLNIQEYTSVCEKLNIPISIYLELPDGKLKKTPDKDRKGVTLKRIKAFLKTGKSSAPTIIRKNIVKPKSTKTAITANSLLYYGAYDTKNPKFMKTLKQLTNGQFKDGAIARHVIRDFWTAGKAPTYKQFAKAWLTAVKNHTRPKEEWAFLTDRAEGFLESDWKTYRIKQANAALRILNSLK